MNQKSQSVITNMNENEEKTELVSMNNTSTNPNYIPYVTASPIGAKTIHSQQKEEIEKCRNQALILYKKKRIQRLIVHEMLDILKKSAINNG